MEADIQILQQTIFLDKVLTVYGTMEDPMFCAKEVADWLGLSNPTDMISRVEEDERSKFNLGRQGETWFLTEDGLYEVLMQSRKPIAKQYKKGVKGILKTIRRTGGYIATKADDTPEEIMARALLVANDTLSRREQRIQQLEHETAVLTERNEVLVAEGERNAPKVEYHDQVLMSQSTYTTNQIAKEMEMSGITLNKKLALMGVQYRQSGQWMLYSRFQNKGYTKTHTYTYTRSSGETGTKLQTVWTEKGRKFIHEMMKM